MNILIHILSGGLLLYVRATLGILVNQVWDLSWGYKGVAQMLGVAYFVNEENLIQILSLSTKRSLWPPRAIFHLKKIWGLINTKQNAWLLSTNFNDFFHPDQNTEHFYNPRKFQGHP